MTAPKHRTPEEQASKLADDLGLHTGPHADAPWQLRVILAALREAADAERRVLVEVIEAQQDLMVAHRLGSHARADRALTRLENAWLAAGQEPR